MLLNKYARLLPATFRFRSIFHDVRCESLATPLIPIRNRDFLAGSKSQNFPEYVTNRSHKELKIVQPNQISNIEELSKYTIEFINENILKTPAILFKKMQLKSVNEFDKFTELLNKKLNVIYLGGSGYREKLTTNVFTASDEPSCFSIEPHNELSYIETGTPSQIMFYCQEAANEGGESPIVFNRDLKQSIKKEVQEKLARKNIKYSRHLADKKNSNYLTWQGTFGVQTKEEAEKKMDDLNVSFYWNADDSLTMWNIVPAIRPHPKTGEMVYFNQANASHSSYYYSHPDYINKQHLKPHEMLFDCTYGDGEPFEKEILDHIRAVTWKCAVGLKLHPGDLLFLDNFLVQHSRMSFKGTRKICVALIE